MDEELKRMYAIMKELSDRVLSLEQSFIIIAEEEGSKFERLTNQNLFEPLMRRVELADSKYNPE